MLHIQRFLVLFTGNFAFQLLDLCLQLLDLFGSIGRAQQGYLLYLCRLYTKLFRHIWNPLQDTFEPNF
jgi:hypothetical protein